MKKTLVLAIVVALCASLCVSCDVFPLKLKGTYIPVGPNLESAPYREFRFSGSHVDAYTTVGHKRMSGSFSIKSGHIAFLWDNGDFDRYSIEKFSGGEAHFWLDGKYAYSDGSYGYF